MPRLRTPLFVLVHAIALAAAAPAQGRQQFDIVLFDPPAGWSHREADGKLLLAPPDDSIRVELARSVALDGDLDAHVQALVKAAERRPEYRLESAPGGGRHAASKGQWRIFLYSERHPDDAAAFLYHAVLLVAAGGRCSTFELLSRRAADYERHRAAFGKLANDAQLTSSIRLERGNPPLTRYALDEALALLEWLLQAPLTEAQKETIETEVRGYWRQRVQAEIDGMQELLRARAELAAMPTAERELARVAVLEQALAQWQKEADSPSARMLLAVHAAANVPIAAGEPPLTRQAVEAFAEYLNFAAGRTVDVEAKLPAAARDQLCQAVAEAWPGLDKEQRELIAGMPMLWAALRVAWPQLEPAERERYTQAWRQDAAIAALGRSLQQQAALASARDLAQRQAQLAAQQMHFRMMSDILRMQHETSRIIISNMGGNTRYTWRW